MNSWQKDYYKRARAVRFSTVFETGELLVWQYTAAEALRYAKVMDRWTNLENAGIVRLQVTEDDLPYDYDDLSDLRPSAQKRHKKEMEYILRTYGVCCFGAQYKDPNTGRWEYGDTIGAVLGNDIDVLGNMQLLDILERTIEELAEAGVQALEEHATYGGVA